MKTKIYEYKSTFTGNTSYFLYIGKYGHLPNSGLPVNALFGTMSKSNAKKVQTYFADIRSIDDITYTDVIWLHHLGGIHGILEDIYKTMSFAKTGKRYLLTA